MSRLHRPVDKNGLPRRIGVSSSSGMSMTWKSTGNTNLSTSTNTSSATPYDFLVLWSANLNCVLLSLIFSNSSFLKMDKGIKLTLEPESRSTFLNVKFLIVHGIATAPGSSLFIGIFLADETKPHFSVAIFDSPPSDLFFANTSFINFLYKGMCSSASKNGRFTSSFLNNLVNFSKSFSFEFFFVTLEGKGSLITGSAPFLIFSSAGLTGG